jgi:hypothetical protein
VSREIRALNPSLALSHLSLGLAVVAACSLFEEEKGIRQSLFDIKPPHVHNCLLGLDAPLLFSLVFPSEREQMFFTISFPVSCRALRHENTLVT